jgi:hypothetical protein
MKNYKSKLLEKEISIAINGPFNFVQNLETLYKLQYLFNAIQQSTNLSKTQQAKLSVQVKHKVKFIVRRLLNPLKAVFKKWIEETGDLNTFLIGDKKTQAQNIYEELFLISNSANFDKILETLTTALNILASNIATLDYLSQLTNISKENLNNLNTIEAAKIAEWNKEIQLLGL